MGGASYVNIMHNLLELKTLRQDEKEVAVTLALIFIDVGIVSASSFTLLADATFLPK
jgi:hypothetical protein